MTGDPHDGRLSPLRRPEEPLGRAAVYFEYSKAADPVARGTVTPIPAARFGPELYRSGPTRVVPLDLSAQLGVPAPATSPALSANFVHLCPGDVLPTAANATSELFHVLRGRGSTRHGDTSITWGAGDFFTLPAGGGAEHRADELSDLYWVHDAPLMQYLGAQPMQARFAPAHYRQADAQHCLDQVASDPGAMDRSRVSVLLANEAMDQTLTVTHVLWAMYGLLPRGGLQPPHRHQSVALDLVLDCEPGCYTLLGDLDESGERLVNTERVDWEPGAVFVTPPGRWHSHHNESGADAHIVPVQDAGLHTYLRSLDIRFMAKDRVAKVLAEHGDRAVGTPG